MNKSNKDISRFAIEFNKCLTSIVNKVSKLDKKSKVADVKNRFKIVVNATPLLLIEDGSPYLWEYRKVIKDIYNGDAYQWEYINNVDFSQYQGDNEIMNIIASIKEVFFTAPDADKIELYELVCDSVEIIARYRTHCKLNNIKLNEAV